MREGRFATPNAANRVGRAMGRLDSGIAANPMARTLVPRIGPVPPIRFEGDAMRWALQDDVLEVELGRSPCNEIGTTALRELEGLAQLLRRGDHGARALVFTSSVDKGFCAGADLRELHQGLTRYRHARVPRLASGVAVRRFIDRIHAVFDTIDTAPLTTVAAVHGFCFGGGFELALTCDVIVADKSARFCFPELRLGLVPGFGGVPRLKRELGNAVIRDLLLSGRSLGASRAHAVGLVSQLVARGQAPGVARRLAAQATRFEPETVAAAKAFAKPHPKRELAHEKKLFIRLLRSETVRAALRRFSESNDVRPYLP